MKWIKKILNIKSDSLPENFEVILERGNVDEIKQVFKTCKYDAKGGYFEGVALSFRLLPDEVARWLVEKGANVNARNKDGETPLHSRAAMIDYDLSCLLDLGADVNLISNNKKYALHGAAQVHHAINTKLLIKNGANVNVRDLYGSSPFELSLDCCRAYNIVNMAKISHQFIGAGLVVNDRIKQKIIDIGTDFEFNRADMKDEWVDASSDSLNQLYQLFDVIPVARQIKHDGVSLIETKQTHWRSQFQELWKQLIPASGPAQTVQGELMRIADKVYYEIN